MRVMRCSRNLIVDLRKKILLIFSNNLKARTSCVSGGMIVVVEAMVLVVGGDDDASVVCERLVLPFSGFDGAGKQEGGSGSPAGCFVIPNALISLPICLFLLPITSKFTCSMLSHRVDLELPPRVEVFGQFCAI